MVWRIHNADDVAVEMGIEVVKFPQANDALLEILFGDEVVWQGSAKSADEVTMGENVKQSIVSSSVTQISMEFTWPPANEGYTLILNFGSGCTVEANW
jgi:SpoU rRNA methylase family enzyme